MAKSLRGILIKFNRGLSWTLAFFSISLLATGYGQTVLNIEFDIARWIHAIQGSFFIVLFLIHASISFFLLWYDWGGNIRKYLRGELSNRSKLRLAQNFTGLVLIVSGFFVSITGIDWFKLGLGWLFPFKSHINYDIFLTFSGVLHVAIGINFALLRKRLKTMRSQPNKVMVSQTRRDSIVLIAGTAVTLFSALYLGSLSQLSSVVEKVASLLPPGQYEVASLRRLHIGLPDPFNEETWTLKVEGLVENPMTLSYSDLMSLPRALRISDFHCVTGWSKLKNAWEGTLFTTIMMKSQPLRKAKFATIECENGYTTSLPLIDLAQDDVMLAYRLDNAELPHQHGGPLRLVVPQKYAYKSAKWVRKIKFTETQQLGYWETRSFSNTADPWTEDRYSSGVLDHISISNRVV
jgi:hypothetical protein